MAKCLVVGGAGFIGSHVTDKLVELGHSVSVIDNLSTGNRKNVNKKAEFFEKDIREDLSDIFNKGFDYVFHLAAQVNVRKSLENPVKDAETNIIGSLNVLDNCVKFKVRKFIFSSTGGAIYSPNAKLPCKEDSEKEPLSPYGVAKFTVENYLRIFKNVFGLNYACLRYSNVYGPRQDAKGEAGVISIFISRAINNEDLIIFGDGEQTRDFIYVKDVVDANIKAMNLEGTYNVATMKETMISELAKEIIKLVGSDSKIVYGNEIKGELKRNVLSYARLKNKGWTPKYNLDNGLRETVEWFKNL